ncbi:hypothetical protein CCP3SC15_780008 [Gammaproteobacteria bacterium]
MCDGVFQGKNVELTVTKDRDSLSLESERHGNTYYNYKSNSYLIPALFLGMSVMMA